MATLAQGVVRRLRNTGRQVPVEERIEQMNNYMRKLKYSGYSEHIRLEILQCGLQGYYKMVARQERGGTPINRDSRVGRPGKKLNKVKKAEDWYCPHRAREESKDGKEEQG